MGKSFIDILEEQIRSDLRKEIEIEIREELQRQERKLERDSTRPSSRAFEGVETWLAARAQKAFFSQESKARRTYQKSASSAAQRTDPHRTSRSHDDPGRKKDGAPRFRPNRIEDLCAAELIRRHSSGHLADSFSLMELKGAWRKAALQTHPDRYAQADAITQARMASLFSEIMAAYEQLVERFETVAKAA